jgi:hypothetical protein
VSFKSISAGELFDLIMPAASVISALLSTWVLASARRRFRFYYALALTIGTLLLPLIVFPIYLVIMLWRKRNDPPPRWRYAVPLLYAAIVLVGVAASFYLDER